MSEKGDDLRLFDTDEHYLGWLGDDPRGAVRAQIEYSFQQQVPGSKLERLKFTDKPHYLTGGKRAPNSEDVVLARAGMAIPFEATVSEPKGGKHELYGAFSWVAVSLDEYENRRDNTWIELGDDAKHTVPLLTARMYFDAEDVGDEDGDQDQDHAKSEG